MPFENFDKRIKEAVEQNDPPFDEKAWDKMDLLLNKVLPVDKKDRRRFYLLLLIAFLLGGGTSFLINKTFNKESVVNNLLQSPVEKKNATERIENYPAIKEDAESNSIITAPLITETGKKQNSTASNKENFSTNTKITHNNNPKPPSESAFVNFKTTKASKENNPPTVADKIRNADQIHPQDTKQSSTDNIQVLANNPMNQEIDKSIADVKNPPNETVTITEQPQPSIITNTNNKPVSKQPKNRKSLLSNLALTASVGPDISMVSFDNMGKLQLTYGAGVSYAVSRKVSIRSGLYYARKMYSAEPSDYNPPKEFWNWYPNLKNIDANCRVFELPILLDYNFGKQQQWFVSGGISSIFMKEENYKYTYRPAYTQQDVTYSRIHKNENNHYFSVINLSGGYTKKISDIISLRAEPYLKIPVSGIGYGKIKLNSGGLLMTVVIKPFSSKKY